MKKSILIVLAILLTLSLRAEEGVKMDRLDWFKDAKLGIFIHWGIYSVNGIDESWSFYNNYIPYEDYMKQASRFTAKKYKPKSWAKLIKSTGAKYAVLTTKHHDGIALWDTKLSELNVLEKTPAGKDLVEPFCKALRDEDIKVGLYYSLIDWSDHRYPNFLINKKRYEKDERKWSEFVEFYQGQLEELSTMYNPDLYWFDGDWEFTAEEWKAEELKEKLLTWNPNVITNSRLQGYGDYETPEQGVPINKPDSETWELCLTMNDSWGYQHNDKNYKSPYEIIHTFVDCISMGGNLLLDIGPKEDGSIPDEQVEILEELARWNRKHYEAVFESDAGIDRKHTDYPTTLSKDKRSLYIFLPHTPTIFVPLRIRGLQSEVVSCTILDKKNTPLKWEKRNSNLIIEAPSAELDPMMSVIKVTLNTEIELTDEFDLNINSIISEDYRAFKGFGLIAQDYIELATKATVNDTMLSSISEQIFKDYSIDSPNPFYFTTLDLKKWINKNQEAFFNAQPGLPEGYFQGRTSLSENRDVLFLYVPGKANGSIAIKGLKNKINRIRVVGSGVKLSWDIHNKLYWNEKPGIVYIDLPKSECDDFMTIIAVQLNGEIELEE